jgi:hypothetical protein
MNIFDRFAIREPGSRRSERVCMAQMHGQVLDQYPLQGRGRRRRRWRRRERGRAEKKKK